MLLQNSKDVFEVQILSRILDDYHKYHSPDFKSFEVLMENDKKPECPRCHSHNILKNGKIEMVLNGLFAKVVERTLILLQTLYSFRQK